MRVARRNILKNQAISFSIRNSRPTTILTLACLPQAKLKEGTFTTEQS